MEANPTTPDTIVPAIEAPEITRSPLARSRRPAPPVAGIDMRNEKGGGRPAPAEGGNRHEEREAGGLLAGQAAQQARPDGGARPGDAGEDGHRLGDPAGPRPLVVELVAGGPLPVPLRVGGGARGERGDEEDPDGAAAGGRVGALAEHAEDQPQDLVAEVDEQGDQRP